MGVEPDRGEHLADLRLRHDAGTAAGVVTSTVERRAGGGDTAADRTGDGVGVLMINGAPPTGGGVTAGAGEVDAGGAGAVTRGADGVGADGVTAGADAVAAGDVGATADFPFGAGADAAGGVGANGFTAGAAIAAAAPFGDGAAGAAAAGAGSVLAAGGGGAATVGDGRAPCRFPSAASTDSPAPMPSALIS